MKKRYQMIPDVSGYRPFLRKTFKGSQNAVPSSLATVSPTRWVAHVPRPVHSGFPSTPQLLTTPCLCLPCSFCLEGTTYPHPPNGQEHLNL